MIRYPDALELQHRRRMLRRLAILRTLLLEMTKRQPRADEDGDSGVVSVVTGWWRSAIGAVRRAFRVSTPPPEPASIVPTAVAVDAHATRQVTREVRRVVGVDVEADRRIGDLSRTQMRALHVAWAREQVSRIVGLEDDAIDDVAEAVARAVAEGRTDLAQVIEARLDVAESRAKLIARDQIGSLNARITQSRQEQLGIVAYTWRSSGDERVRPLHRRLDGTVRRWDDPHPTEGHPGQAIACRCTAEPVLDDALVPARAGESAPPPAPVTPIPRPVTFGEPLSPPPSAPARGRPPVVTQRPPRPRASPASSGDPPPTPPAPPALSPAPPPAPSAPVTPARPPLDLSGVRDLQILPDLSREEQIEAIREVVGFDATPEDVIGWAGIVQDDLDNRTRIELHTSGRSLELIVSTRAFRATRTYRREIVSRQLVAEHEALYVTDKGEGHGSRLFSRAVAELRRAGFTRIDTFAAGQLGDTYNGYYTWPRLGFNAKIPARLRPQLPEALQGAQTLQDLYATPEGREWWRINGRSTRMSFELDPDSPSSRVHAAYLAERAGRGDAADEERDRTVQERLARTGQAEEIDLNAEEEEALERAWARLDRERAGR